MRKPSVLLVVLATSGCVRDVGLGPDLGDCAVYPTDPYTFGEPGIGRCLAGPAAMAFHVSNGHTWLAVANSDPFRLFSAGSFLEIDADDLAAAEGTITSDALTSYALDTEPFVGGFSIVRDGTLAVVTSRYSAGSSFRRVDDRAWLVDVSDPTRPAYLAPRFLTVGADPYGTAEDPDAGRLYVLNATDTSISVLDIAHDPPSLIDPAPASIITDPVAVPVPGSIGRAELIATLVSGARIDRTDGWTATWVEGTYRLWVPTPQPDAGDGLSRFSTGGPEDAIVPSGFGVEIDPTQSGFVTRIEDPWVATAGTSLVMFLSDGERLFLATTDGTAGTWIFDATNVVSGASADAALQSGPTVLTVDGTPTMYFDGRATAGGSASVFRATSVDGVRFTAQGPAVLTPPAGADAIEQPSALIDPFTGAVRVFASARTGDHWDVVTATGSDAGATFDAPDVVIDAPGHGAGAPFVAWVGGRFQMWLSIDDGDTWAQATAWSWDGFSWSEPLPRLDTGIANTEPPPRAAVQAAPMLSWRLTGESAGVQSPLVVSGVGWQSSLLGFRLSAAWGQDTGLEAIGDDEGGLLPGSLIDVDGEPTLYATVLDGEGQPRIAALRRVADRWVGVADDLIPLGVGGNTAGASDPAVFERDGQIHMVYAAHVGDASVLRQATSDDGLHFRAVDADVLAAPDSFASVQQVPHAAIADGDGVALWYAGFDGSRWRIGTLHTDDGTTWTKAPGAAEAFRLGVGDPGTFDDSGVRDPAPVIENGRLALWYAGFDGAAWRIGVAVQQDDGTFVRRPSPTTGDPAPMLDLVARSFATAGVQSPVVQAEGDGTTTLWFGGNDGIAWRIGRAHGTSDGLWPQLQFPTAGDVLSFVTRRGEPGRSKIELGQIIQNFVLPGAPGTTLREGPTSAVLDRERGMLFVGSEDLPGVVVVDVRDDGTDTFDDLNYLDIETVLRFGNVSNLMGITAMTRGPDGLLYLSTREPDGVLVLDPAIVVDDADKESIAGVPVGILPMHDNVDDDGDVTYAAVGAAGLAMVPSQQLLIVTHLRDNSVSIFDLSLGAYGEEIRHLEDVGENPSTVVVSPDERYAVIGTFLGQTPSGDDASSLAILDLDPASPTYLQIRARIVNR